MKIKSQQDFWSGLLFIVIGIAFAWAATNYRFDDSTHPGPGYFPFGLGVLLAVLGALLLFKALTLEVEGGGQVGAWSWRPLAIIVGSVLIFAWTLPNLGLFVALPLLVLLSASASAEFRWKDAIINAIVLTAGSWAIFIWGLKLVIPLWPDFKGLTG